MKIKPRRWGRWRLVPGINALQLRQQDGFLLYEIDLDQMRTSAECLDWIFQATNKNWITAQDSADLIEALRETVDPQARLCSWGIEQNPPSNAKSHS